MLRLHRAFPDVYAVYTADFDGDGILDILSVSLGEHSGCSTLAIHWCSIVQGQLTTGE